eukprot:m.421186 g.421186  ORF g.421186 m.421186 type:complete len:101 (-) comp20194_c0_seq9:566-868(-)
MRHKCTNVGSRTCRVRGDARKSENCNFPPPEDSANASLVEHKTSNLIQAVHEERGPHEIPDATLTTPAHAKQLARACWTDARAAKLRSAEQSALRSAATN